LFLPPRSGIMILAVGFNPRKAHINCLVASATPESPPQITLIIFHTMFLQEFEILILKGLRLMVLALVLNVTQNTWHIRFTYTERAITILPAEILQISKRLMNPFRGITFEAFGNITWRHHRRSHY